jgi:hypothetical protein
MSIERRTRREVLLAFAVPALAAAAQPPAKTSKPLADDLTLDKVPVPIKRAAHRLLKDARWDSAMKGSEDGQDFYELFGTHEKGLNVSCQISADGKVTSVELQIEGKEVPRAVHAAFAKAASFKPETMLALYEADEIHDLSKTEPTYLLSGSTPKGKDISVELTTKGEVVELKQEIELSEVPKLISDTLASKAPRYKPEVVHRITRNDKLAGYLFANPRRVAWVSHDGKEFEIHKEE